MVGVTPGSGPDRRALTTRAKPLVRQSVLLVPVALDLLMLLLWGTPDGVGTFYVSGFALLVAATMISVGPLVVSVPLPRSLLFVALPVIDLAAIGLMRMVPDGNGLGVLAVLPAMWLAADHKLRGVAVALGSTLLLVSAPSLAYFGTDVAWWSRALLVPVIVGMCAVTVAGTSQLWERQNRALEEQGRRLEEALDEVIANQALNEAIVTTVEVGLVALDKDGNYRVVNPRHHEFLELTYPEGHGGRAGQMGYTFAANRVTPLTHEELPTVRAMAGEAFCDYVIWIGEHLEDRRALSVSAKPVLDAAGEFDGAVLVYQDITDLMSALKVKDDFVASVSHELRTPLTAIMGFLDLVLDEEDSVTPSVRQQLGVVKRNSERLLRLVSDLLFSAQVREGRLALDLEPLDLAVLSWQAVADHAPRAASEGVELRHDLPESLLVQADPVRIRQVLDNLLSNALKYTPSGGTVAFRLHELPDDEIALVVSDTGIGIDRRELTRLFTRFFRGQEAEMLAIQGVGLGLSITKSIVESHDGHIEVQSRAGEGSTFTVVLPRSGPLCATDAEPEEQLVRPATAAS
jgi:two-component system phosphate regulon sensor histidine kinase PhoR